MSALMPVQPAAVKAQIELARQLAASNMLPKQYQQRPENLLWAIQYAESLGVHPMVAVTSIHVIDGKPSASAQLIGGLVRKAGHKLRVTFDKKTMCATAQIIRADDPSFTFESRWDLERAKAAGLAGKAVWKQYPDAMLKARAITEVARDAAPESLYGVIYTAEELGAEVEVDGDGEMIVVDGVVEEPGVTDGQRARIEELRSQLNLTPQQLEQGLRTATGLGDIDLISSADADSVISRMEARLAAAAAPAPEPADVQFDGSEVSTV